MGIVNNIYNQFNFNPKNKLIHEKEKISHYLLTLKNVEAKLWGVIIKDISHDEERVLEDTNHLIYLYSRGKHEDLKKILESKDFKEFLHDLDKLRKIFLILKKEIREKEKLKYLISNFTIKLVDSNNYEKFKNVFLLERVLYEILDKQDEDLIFLMDDLNKLKINSEEMKFEVFLRTLKDIRKILSGHLDHHYLFEEERYGYSNTSNVLYELIKIFKTDLD
ncbi:MAG: hypothetical protein PF569_07725 [Candidatus Woesearchaeota archaeon]|jgi:hypothetical protein|nr:hypothetical protein [Candidatus Woesearchaeota archaeon]